MMNTERKKEELRRIILISKLISEPERATWLEIRAYVNCG